MERGRRRMVADLAAGREIIAAAGAFILLFFASPVLGDDFKKIARDLSRAASHAHVARITVLPFESADGTEAREGWSIAERLSTQFVRLGRVRTVERNLIQKVLEEQRLARTGALASEAGRDLGGIDPADGIVTGSFVIQGAKVLVAARLMRAQSGLVLAAAEGKVERMNPEAALSSPAAARRAPSRLLAPEFTSDPPGEFLTEPLADFLFEPSRISAGEYPASQDAAAPACRDAARSADELESGILDLKARYWALRLKKGRSSRILPADPGATIFEPELRRRFYEYFNFWSAQDRIPELNPTEMVTFLVIERKAYALRERCAITTAEGI